MKRISSMIESIHPVPLATRACCGTRWGGILVIKPFAGSAAAQPRRLAGPHPIVPQLAPEQYARGRW
jgi:hypothetical protein